MNLDNLNDLIVRKNQRFKCKPAGGATEHDTECFEALIVHEVLPSLGKAELDVLASRLGSQSDMIDLLSHYGGIRLYCDSISGDSAYYISHPNEWEKLRGELFKWFEELDEDEANDMIPDWVEKAVVFGEVPSSGNYYLMPLEGVEAGKVYEFEHDGFEFIKLGETLQEFLDYLCTVTDNLIENIGSHTRYSDGKTDIQWIPQRYNYSKN
jgi:SMI1-KNR4 cell-wall